MKRNTCSGSGLSYSQAVLAVFAKDFGLDQDMALKIPQGFGGGVAHTDHICGAASGVIMAIRLRYGRTRAGRRHIRS